MSILKLNLNKVNSSIEYFPMAGEVIVDALPYIDQGYDDPGVREAVNILINFF